MKRYSARIEIEAPPEHVWRVLADVETWPLWDPTTAKAEGVVAKNQTLTLESSLAPGRSMPVTVTAVDEPFLLEWASDEGASSPRLRTYRITPKTGGEGSGGSIVEVSEEVSRPLPERTGGSFPDLDKAFADFLSELKMRVEAGQAG